jgi:hypothetical protein
VQAPQDAKASSWAGELAAALKPEVERLFEGVSIQLGAEVPT